MKQYLSKEFLKKYEEVKPPFTELGEFVYLRTYSRWVESKGRRENWLETCERTINYNVDLAGRKSGVLSFEALQKEAEFLFDNMYMLRTFTSGRSMWVGGTEVAERFGLSNFNCCFTQILKFEDFKDVFYLLMLGAGVGIRVLKEDVAELPSFRHNVKLISKNYTPVPNYARLEGSQLIIEGNTATIVIGDSKEGWVSSLGMYFELLTKEEYSAIDTILVNYDNVRGKGERLKRFGGRSSGHTSMKKMLEKIHVVMQSAEGKLRPIHALDVSNIIAENVVSGGVRRSSEMILFDADDKEILDSKSNLFVQNDKGEWVKNEAIGHRSNSNNSIFFNEKPSREMLHDIMTRIRFSGEPGFINAEEGRRRKKGFKGVNPCGEILLLNKECCNLVTNNMTAFVTNGVLRVPELIEVLKSSVRASIRMTLVELELKAWQEVANEDPIVGVSLTGYQDMVEATGLTMKEQRNLLRLLKKSVKDEAERYSKELGIKTPNLVTTCKPEGTISQLPTVSSGVHYSYAPYFIRRVRISAFDPLVQLAEELGYELFDDPTAPETKVIEFPVKAPVQKTGNSVSAIEQLEIYKMFMEEWTDHNTSITVQVRDNEWEEVEKWVYENWNTVVGVTFLSLFDNYYPLLPYEAIDEAEYLKRKAVAKSFSSELLSKYEEVETELDLGNDGCTGGVCPIR